jgi:hypothetical protein
MDLTQKVRDELVGRQLMFAYRGPVTGDNSVLLLTLLEKEMELSDYSFVGRKRLFMFVLENLQNITRHSLNLGNHGMSLVIYTKTEDGYTVTTGNAIINEEVKELKDRLEEINRLDPEQIKEIYRTVLQSSDLSSKGGAGLGLLEMARKTGNRLDFDFIPLDNDHSYFILSKTVDAGGKGIHSPGSEDGYSGERAVYLEKMMQKEDVYFIWAGHMTHDIGREVLSFNEMKMHEEDTENNLQKRVFTILIELLQNVANYSPGIEAEQKFGIPVAMIRTEKDCYIITSGNLIQKSGIATLKRKLDMVNKKDKEGLKKLLHTGLKEQDMQIESTGYLGLLEIARHSGDKLRYEFTDVNEEYSYYVITIKVKSRATVID